MNEKEEDVAYEFAAQVMERMHDAVGMINSEHKPPECSDPDQGVIMEMTFRTIPNLERYVATVIVSVKKVERSSHV